MGINNINSYVSKNNTNINYPSYNAVQINMDTPMVNAMPTAGIYNYPKADGQIFYPPIQTSKPTIQNDNRITITPSGVNDYNNYTEIDKYGNEIANIIYSKKGDTLIQNLRTKSPDGTIVEKVLTNSPNFKTSHINITDENGNVIYTKDKSYKKIDDNNAQTIVNNDIYNISGLAGNVITIEHNGEKVEIDLNKMLNSDVKPLKAKTSPENFDIRKEKISDNEKEKLFNRIKSLGGDDLIRLSKSVEHLQYLDEKSIESFFVDGGKTLLLSPKDYENSHMVTEHELGHAINHSTVIIGHDEISKLLSDDKNFIDIRNYEKENFVNNNNKTNGDKFFADKFLFGNSELAWEDINDDKDFEEANLRDETFAECYNNLNNMDIIHYENEVLPMRTLSLFKYLPKTMIEADKLANI